jgi:3-hydroxyisobutyrate dehydrogenase-like beta-hydroxyacid dehydrogenase
MRVGFLGLGEMGGPMASFVVAAGHEVALYDPVDDAVRARTASNARAASSPADAAASAEVVCVVVRDDEQSIAAIDGADGVLRAASPGSVVVLHATVAPATVRRLARACTDAGARFVDAGISGGAAGAQAGTLYVMCGGEPDAIEAARPVLEAYARHIVRFGDTGAGMAAKLARNLVHYCVWVSVHEGMALAEAAGLDLRAFEHLVRESGVPDLVRLQLAKETTAPIDPDDDPQRLAWLRKTVELGWKDLDDAVELADEVGVQVDMATVARRRYGASMNYPV